jgi:hypothetical protein
MHFTGPISPLRHFPSTGKTLGVGKDHESWFVFDRDRGGEWHVHTGPYRSFGQAADWVRNQGPSPGSPWR